MCPRRCLSSIYRLDGETYNQAHICPPHCFFFSGRATFSSLWQGKRKFFPTVPKSSVSTVHSEKCVSFMSDVFGLFLPVHNARRSFFFPLSLVVEGGKEALSHWWALLQTDLSGDFFAPFPLAFFQMHLRDTALDNYISFRMTFHLLICSVMVPHFLVIY